MRVIVTGAASGIGAAIGRKLAAVYGPQARLILSDLNAPALDSVARQLDGVDGCRAIAVAGDISMGEAPHELAQIARREFGGLDALFSNVGISGRGQVIDAGIEDWDKLFAVNVRAPLFLVQAVAGLLEQSRGSVVMTTSMCGSHPSPLGPYSVTKAALVMLMKQLSVELGRKGVRVNSISPSWVETAASVQLFSNPEMRKRKESHVPLGRLAAAEELADVAAFLISRDARYVSGVDLQVDAAFANTLIYATQKEGDWDPPARRDPALSASA